MAGTVGRLGVTTTLTHSFIYFAPEATAEYEAIGLPAEHHYFASRGAALGPVGPEVIIATFFNFSPATVRASIPAAWQLADPTTVQAARMRAATTVFGRACGVLGDGELDEALSLAHAIVDGVGDAGVPLAAANRSVPLPDDPVTRLWQLITVIREWRGDAHVAVLTADALTPVEALLLHVASGAVTAPAIRSTRRWPDEDWNAGIVRLSERGLLCSDGSPTADGLAYRQEIEDRTDRAAQPLVDAVGDARATRWCDLLKPVRTALIESGAFDVMRRP